MMLLTKIDGGAKGLVTDVSGLDARDTR